MLECADLRFDPATREVTVSGEPVALTAIESSLVELLLRRSPSVLTRRMIATQVWDDEADAVGSNTIDVHVGRVRAKLAGSRAHIETVRGHGLPDGRDVNTTRAHRRHAVRVAAVATLIVMVFYVVAAIVLNLIVTNHLISTTDNRLADRLEDARQQTLALPRSSRPGRGHGPRRCAGVPVVDRALGEVTPLTPTAPSLPSTSLGLRPGHARHRRLDLPLRHVAERTMRCWWPVRARPRTAERPVGAAGRRTRLRRDPGRRRVRRSDGGRSAGLCAVGAGPSPAGGIHRRCVA